MDNVLYVCIDCLTIYTECNNVLISTCCESYIEPVYERRDSLSYSMACKLLEYQKSVSCSGPCLTMFDK